MKKSCNQIAANASNIKRSLVEIYFIERKEWAESPKVLPDYLIVQKVLEGQTELFEILMIRYNELLYRVIRSYIDQDADVEDTMQEAYVKAYQKLYQFKNEAMFSTWLVRIGINEALQRIRNRKKHQSVAITSASEALQIADSPFVSPETETINKESAMFIEKAIDALPNKYKIIYMLKEIEGMDISEISKSLNLSKTNVKVRLHRARNMMKEYIFKATNTANVFEFGNAKCDRVVENVMSRIKNIEL